MNAEHYYKDVPGYFDFEQVYREAAAWIPDGGTFVEVGCWQGMSLSFLLVELFNSGKKVKVVGVDHFRGTVGELIGEEAKLKSVGAHCMHNLRRASYPYALIKADSTYGCDFLPDGSCDYVFIDGSHDYESVVADLKAWRPKVRRGGILAGHDYNQRPVSKAVHDVLPEAQVDHVKNLDGNGSVIWGTCWRIQL